MTKPVPGLNPYRSDAKRELAFVRFQWVLPGTLARSGQPNYTGTDADHTVRPFDVTFLQLNKIVCVVSANSRDMSGEGKDRLAKAGIHFHHARMEDFGAPTPAQLHEVANLIERHRTREQNPGASLVYCGFGEGRTGTYVAGWAMLKHMENRLDKKAMCGLNSLRTQFGVENQAQALVINAVATGRRLSQVSQASIAPLPGLGSGSFKGPTPSFDMDMF